MSQMNENPADLIQITVKMFFFQIYLINIYCAYKKDIFEFLLYSKLHNNNCQMSVIWKFLLVFVFHFGNHDNSNCKKNHFSFTLLHCSKDFVLESCKKYFFYSESSLTRLGHEIGALDRDCVRVMTVRGMWVALLAKKISDQFFWRKKFICKNASSKTRKLQVLLDNNSGESCNNL